MPRFVAVFNTRGKGSDLADALSIVRQISPRIEIALPSGLLFKTTLRSERTILEKLLEAGDGRNFKAAAASTRIAALLAAAHSLEGIALRTSHFALRTCIVNVAPALWAGDARLKQALPRPTGPGLQSSSRFRNARHSELRIVPPGRERDFLASFPLELLSRITDDESYHSHLHTLSKWGIRTLGELAQLPDAELAARLGSSGIRLQKMARGEDVGLFQMDEETPVFKESEELEWTLDSLEPLAFILGKFLERLCTRLRSSGKAAETIHITLNLDNQTCYRRTLRLAFPLRNPKTLLSLLRLELQSHSPKVGIVGVALEAIPAPHRVIQYSLLEASTLNPEKLAQTLARLQATLRGAHIGSPVLLDSHRPDSFEMQDCIGGCSHGPVGRGTTALPWSAPAGGGRSTAHRAGATLALRRIRSPKPLRIRPDQIVVCSGPWRTSGNWWKDASDEWSRDEWDIEFLDGSLCRIYWDHREKRWYLEGIYD